MKIAIPTMGNNDGVKEQVYNHFGSAAFFALYDTETRAAEIFANNNEDHGHGGCHPVQTLRDKSVGAVLTGGMGRRAIALFNQVGIKVYQLEGGTVEEAIKKFENNELAEMDMNTACSGHGHGDECGH